MRSGEKLVSKNVLALASSLGSNDLAARQGSFSEPFSAFGSEAPVCALIERQLARNVL